MRVSTVAISLVVASCGSVQKSPDASPACTPGASMACLGPNGCGGAQICSASGIGYGTCDCVSPSDASDDGLDAMDESTTDASDAGPFSPSKLPGLVLWLDGSKGVTLSNGLVIKWADQSPNGNNALEPVDKSSCVQAVSVVNGHDVVRCGAQQWLSVNDAQTLQFGTGSFGIAAVARWPNGGGSTRSVLYSKGSSGDKSMGFIVSESSSVLQMTTPTAAVAAPLSNLGSFHVVTFRGPALEIRVDGVASTGTSSSSDISFPAWPVDFNDSNLMAGTDYAEVIAVKGQLTNGDAAALEAYLKAKYAL